MGPGIIRHIQVWWSIARIAGIWHRLKYFDENSNPGLLGVCNNTAISLLWPQDDETLRNTARHEAFHLSLLNLSSKRWTDIDALGVEAWAVAMSDPALAAVIRSYEARGFPVVDEPLVLLCEAMEDRGSLRLPSASPRLAALIREIIRPKPLKPALWAALHVLLSIGMVVTILVAQ